DPSGEAKSSRGWALSCRSVWQSSSGRRPPTARPDDLAKGHLEKGIARLAITVTQRANDQARERVGRLPLTRIGRKLDKHVGNEPGWWSDARVSPEVR